MEAKLIVTIFFYFMGSKYVFDKINESLHLQMVVDEIFHIPQGMQYCFHNFTHWDPKITTLPGLYLFSTMMISNLFECNVYNLRLINLLVSCANIGLVYLLLKDLKYIFGNTTNIILQALTLALLPPLYFFSHLYYTDTLSVMSVLAYTKFYSHGNFNFFTLLVGFFCIIVRQTNIVWIALLLGYKLIRLFFISARMKYKRCYNFFDLIYAIKYHLRYKTALVAYLTRDNVIQLLNPVVIIIGFITFVIINGSIVVGDKDAHQASLHLTQIFYFLIFYGVFGMPYVLVNFLSTIKKMIKNWFIVLLMCLCFLLIVHFNTQVHPYLLADNRHYTFYVWNRWFGKYPFAVYVTVPVYVFLLFNLHENFKGNVCIAFLLPYCVCTLLVLVLQKMIEVRYFIMPYLIIRMCFRQMSRSVIYIELLWFLLLNAITLHLFLTKEIKWQNFDYPQRLIW